ncbi:hypothetical protein [Streptomyces sp. NPDC002580]|uniref:hypothetical protein n=1 Tax=Streptomyces sp. NPDC002580 TaxID=3364653 RepID=UPI0036A04E18
MSWQPGDPEARPQVYLPQGDAETPLAYEAYHDPAEAHGWRKVSAEGDGDETAALDIVPGGRADRRERTRGHRRTRLTRRLAVAGGAACVVVLGVAVVGALDPGALEGPGGGDPGPTAGPVRLATGPAEPVGDESPAAAVSVAPRSDPPPSPSATASATSSVTVSTPESASADAVSPGESASGSPSASASTSVSASPTPTDSASPSPADSATGGAGGHGPGHGHGGGHGDG